MARQVIRTQWWQLVEDEDLYVVDSDYLFKFECARDLGRRLHLKLVELADESDRRAHWQPESDYSKVVRWSHAITAPVLCTFPFFLTTSRRGAWGVVQYGRQTRLGLLGRTALFTGLVSHGKADRIESSAVLSLIERGDVWAGLELGSRLIVNTVPPEDAAWFFRGSEKKKRRR